MSAPSLLEIEEEFFDSVRELLPNGVRLIEDDDGIYIGFHPELSSREIYDTLERVGVFWKHNLPDEFAEYKEFGDPPLGYIMDDEYPDDIDFWIENGHLRTIRGDIITPQDRPVEKKYLGEPDYDERDRNTVAISMLKEAGVHEPNYDRIKHAKKFIDGNRWDHDLSGYIVKLSADQDTNSVNNVTDQIYTYMDILEASEALPSATTWDELIRDMKQSWTYQASGGGKFPPIRTISGFEDIQSDDFSDLPQYHDITGRRRVRDVIDDVELPGYSEVPDLDDLRSEIDRFKEDRPRIDRNREEYRGGSGRDPGYQRRRGRGRMT